MSQLLKIKKNWAKRWASLFKIMETPSPKVIACTVDNLLPFWPPPETLQDNYYFVSVGDQIPYDEIIEVFVQFGYNRTKLTTNIGEFSVRGDVVDVFPPGYHSPIRIDLFGDLIEGIRTFDPMSQRSKDTLDHVVILPVTPAIFKDTLVKDAKELWHYFWKTGLLNKQAISLFEDPTYLEENSILPGIFYKGSTSINEYLIENTIYFLVEPEMLRRTLDDCELSWKNFLDKQRENKGIKIPYDKVFNTASQAKGLWVNKQKIIFDSLSGKEYSTVQLPEQKYFSFSDLFWRPEEKKASYFNTYINLAGVVKDKKNQVVLTFRNNKSKK